MIFTFELRMVGLGSAADAFSQRPLSRAFRPFMGPISKARLGSISLAREAAGECPLSAQSRRPCADTYRSAGGTPGRAPLRRGRVGVEITAYAEGIADCRAHAEEWRKMVEHERSLGLPRDCLYIHIPQSRTLTRLSTLTEPARCPPSASALWAAQPPFGPFANDPEQVVRQRL